nr:MAG TPA: hypothetical protein [Caudoviricetes sp.]
MVSFCFSFRSTIRLIAPHCFRFIYCAPPFN